MPDLNLTEEQRILLWKAFADGHPGGNAGPNDRHWTAGVDRMAAALAPMLDGEYEKARAEANRLDAQIKDLSIWLVEHTGEPKGSYSAVDAAKNAITELITERDQARGELERVKGEHWNAFGIRHLAEERAKYDDETMRIGGLAYKRRALPEALGETLRELDAITRVLQENGFTPNRFGAYALANNYAAAREARNEAEEQARMLAVENNALKLLPDRARFDEVVAEKNEAIKAWGQAEDAARDARAEFDELHKRARNLPGWCHAGACPPGCVECGGPDDCECYEHQDNATEAPVDEELNADLQREYRCRDCDRWALWTNGTLAEDNGGTALFWCQTCSAEMPLNSMDSRPRRAEVSTGDLAAMLDEVLRHVTALPSNMRYRSRLGARPALAKASTPARPTANDRPAGSGVISASEYTRRGSSKYDPSTAFNSAVAELAAGIGIPEEIPTADELLTESAEQASDAWNAAHPVGTAVRYWKGLQEGEGRLGYTRSEAILLGGHTPVVWIDSTTGAIGLTHVEPVPEGVTLIEDPPLTANALPSYRVVPVLVDPVEEDCEDCEGTGKAGTWSQPAGQPYADYGPDPCSSCRGTGRTAVTNPAHDETTDPE